MVPDQSGRKFARVTLEAVQFLEANEREICPQSALADSMERIGRTTRLATKRGLNRASDDFVVLVRSGLISAKISAQTGNELQVQSYGPGDLCVVPAITNLEPFYIRYVAESESVVSIAPLAKLLTGSECRELCEKQAALHYRRLLADCFRLMHEIAFMPSAQRLYSELLRLDSRAGGKPFLFPTHKALALRLATSRETISREIAFLRRESVLEMNEHYGKVIDRKFLLRKIRVALDLTTEEEVLRCVGLQ